MPSVSITLTARQHADLVTAIRNSDLPSGLSRMLDRAANNGDGTRTLRLDSAVAKMVTTSLTPTALTRAALNELDLAFYGAGGPDTGFAERSLIEAAHERGAEILQRSEAA